MMMRTATVLFMAAGLFSIGCLPSSDGGGGGEGTTSQGGGSSSATSGTSGQAAGAGQSDANNAFGNFFGRSPSSDEAAAANGATDGADEFDDGATGDSDAQGEQGSSSEEVVDTGPKVTPQQCADICPRIVGCLDTVCMLGLSDADRTALAQQCSSACADDAPPEAELAGIELALANECGGLQTVSNDVCDGFIRGRDSGDVFESDDVDEFDDGDEFDDVDEIDGETTGPGVLGGDPTCMAMCQVLFSPAAPGDAFDCAYEIIVDSDVILPCASPSSVDECVACVTGSRVNASVCADVATECVD